MRPRLKWVRKPEKPSKAVLDYRSPETKDPNDELPTWSKTLAEWLAVLFAEIFAQIVLPIAALFATAYYLAYGCK